MVRVYQRVVLLGVAHHAVVATDDGEVLAVCAEHGVPAVLTRLDHPSGTDRVAEVAERPEFAHFDVILNVQGDEPFVAHDALAGAVAIVVEGKAPIGTAAVPIGPEALHQPDVVKVVCTDSGHALYFSRANIPFLRESNDAALRDPLVRQHVGVYAYTREALMQWVGWKPHALELIERLEQLRPLAHGVAIGVATAAAAQGGIDTEDDLVRANERWAVFDAMTGVPSLLT